MFLLLVLCACSTAATDANAGGISIFVDGADSPVKEKNFTLKRAPSSIRFEWEPDTVRSRYMLEGLNGDWLPQAGRMNFIVRFLDRNRDQILQVFFPASNQSEGWGGTVKNSAFTSREEEVIVPEEAAYISIAISSAGPSQTVGIYAATGIRIRSVGAGTNGEAGPLIDGWAPGMQASLWNKSGTHASMASALQLELGGRESRVLLIEDDDLSAHADWEMNILSLPEVKPGEKLELVWKEAYSIGLGGPLVVEFERIPYGSYRFAVQGLDLAGVPSNETEHIEFKVIRPYWETVWFWALIAAAVAILSARWGRYVIRKKIRREQRHTQLIADERLRIARDLHDDLGTRLSHIHLLGSHALSTTSGSEDSEAFRKITDMSKELMHSLSETVWMLNPNNGDLEALVNFLCRLVDELCKLSQIKCRIDALSVDETIPVSHKFRHNISLAVKETINNALKHSRAAEIRMKISKEGTRLKILITDDGVGIDPDRSKRGSGLESLAHRMATLKGTYAMKRLSSAETQVTLTAPLG